MGNTKAATDYLAASGATAISIIEAKGVCAFRIGLKIDQNAVAVYWLPEPNAALIVKQVRRDAGRTPDADVATAALHRAAADNRTTLTPHATATERAGNAVRQLDAHLDAMRGSGVLAEFNREYKRQREAATLRGEGYMPFSTATARLRRALIPLLIGGKQLAVGQSLFAEIFR
jgi:hypothetical protein